MKEIRYLLLLFFSVVATRLWSEGSMCQVGTETVCHVGVMLVAPFILSAYFFDSAFVELYQGDNKKRKIANIILIIPYLVALGYFTYYFFFTISAVTIEYLVTVKLFISILIFVGITVLNNLNIIRKLNTVFMVTFLLSVFLFQFI